MEMERVPKAGYSIVGLDIRGIDRKNWHRNIGLPFRLISSGAKAIRLILKFRPHAVVGTGGYASGPVLAAASWLGYRCLIQEQNSLPGLTNRWLGRKVDRVCTAFPGLERYFPSSKIRWFGNPIRAQLLVPIDRFEARSRFGFGFEGNVLLVLGGSLGARSINSALEKSIDRWLEQGVQVIWQTGSVYADRLIPRYQDRPGLWIAPFVEDMAGAYAAADLVISRAGATTVSELAALGKPSILVPSPNVAEDHQTHNARALSDLGAAVTLPENELDELLSTRVLALLGDSELRARMGAKAREWGRPDATERIVDELIQLMNR